MESGNSEHSGYVINKTRLEFVVDGIFAIAMTLLVLELKIPDLDNRDSVHELLNALVNHFPTFASYLLSFLVLGMLWYRNNSYYRHFLFISKGMLVSQLLQLSVAAFFPFAASLMGRYPTNELSFLIYVGCITVYLWSSFINWVWAKHVGAIDTQLSRQKYVRHRNRQLIGSIIFSLLFAIYLVTLSAN